MRTEKQKFRLGGSVLTSVDNGKYKIRVMHPLKKELPDELIRNVLLKIS
jgi:hypothetical protein